MFKKIEEDIKNTKYDNALKKLNEIRGKLSNSNKYFILLAHVSFRCEEYNLSSKIYKIIFQKNIQNARAYAEYTNILIKENNNNKAISFLEEAIEKFPEQVSFIRTLIGISRQNKDLNYELNLCEKLFYLDSNNKSNHKALINILLRIKNYERINIQLKKSKKKFGDNCFLLEEIKYFIELEEFEMALNKYKMLELITPENHAIYIGQYRMYDKLQNNKAAEQVLLKGEKHADNKYSILEALGNFYLRSTRYTLSIRCFKILIELNHLEIKNYVKLAQVYQKIENFEMALKELKISLEIEPNNNEILLNLGIIEMKLFHFDSAQILFTKILKKTPNYTKATTYLIALEREKNTYTKKVKQYNKFSDLQPKSKSDYLVYIDKKIEFLNINESINLCNESLKKYSNNLDFLARLIILKLEKKDFSIPLKDWNNLLMQPNNSNALLYVTTHLKKHFLLNNDIKKIVERSFKKLSEKISYNNNFRIKNIAIIGGSNSITKEGWNPIFQDNMLNFLNINVDNYALGGISSLYGLFLIKEKRLFEQYNLIIFEYTLNDIYFNYFNGYDHLLLESVLKETLIEAEKYNSKIIFMLMSPLDNLNLLEQDTCNITKIYTKIATHSSNAYLFNVYDFIDSKNYSSSDFYQMLYSDNMHYTSRCAKNIANILSLKIITQDIFNDSKSSQYLEEASSNINLSDITLLLPEKYEISGKHTYEEKGSSIIKRNFLCIKNDTQIKVNIPKGKRVLALLINSSEYTGYVKIKFNKEMFIKNIFAERPINDPIKARIYLKQFTKIMINNQKDTCLHLSLKLDEADLANLELDTTVYPQPPRAKLVELELEIAGILIS